MAETESRSGVQSLDRAFRILRTFDSEHPERGLSEIARLVELAPSTTHRLLGTMQAHGFVRQTADGSRYALGAELLRLAEAHHTFALGELARPVMVELRDSTEETVALHIVNDRPARVVVDQVESRHALRRTYTDVGETIPIHAGAASRILLANLPRPMRERVVSARLRDPRTGEILDPDALRDNLAEVRQLGYATSIEERLPGISAVAVGIRDHGGHVVAALNVSGPSMRVTPTRLVELIEPTLAAGHRLSDAMGYRESTSVEAGE